MQITFTGTSHGVPEPNRKCSSAMIEVRGRYYFIDMGTPAIDELVTRHIPIDAVKGVFITHMHGDHTDGLISFVDLISWYFKTADPQIFLPVIEGRQIILDWLRITGSSVREEIRFAQVEAGVIFDDGFLKVTAIPTQHCYRSFAYLVEAEGKTVLFTGDLKHPTVDFPEIVKQRPTDLLICESAHFPSTEYAPVLKQCDTKQVCINHYVPWNIPNIQALAKEMGDLPVYMANDGMCITL